MQTPSLIMISRASALCIGGPGSATRHAVEDARLRVIGAITND